MDFPDALLLMLLALVDLVFLVYRRQQRKDAIQRQRVMDSLRTAVRRPA